MAPCASVSAAPWSQRVWQHQQDLDPGFTTRHGVHRLVHYELFATMEQAIQREKRLKKWERKWKLRLIEEGNPQWRDLWPEIQGAQRKKAADGRLSCPPTLRG